MRGVLVAAVAAALALPSPASAAKFEKGFPAGFWYGEAKPRKVDTIWLAQFLPNGNFTAHFRICDRTNPHDDTETGTWAYDKGVFTLYIQMMNGVMQTGTQHYTTLSYDGRTWRYHYPVIPFDFTSVRVNGAFTLPECGAIS